MEKDIKSQLSKENLQKDQKNYLIQMFSENLSVQTTLKVSKIEHGIKISKNTIKKYFKLFNILVFYYMRRLRDGIQLRGEIEIDETVV